MDSHLAPTEDLVEWLVFVGRVSERKRPHVGCCVPLRRRDDERPETIAASTSRRAALDVCDRLGGTEAEFSRHEGLLSSAMTKPVEPSDVLWSLANATLVAAARRGDWHAVARTYLEMGALVEAEGQSGTALFEEACTALHRASTVTRRSAPVA